MSDTYMGNDAADVPTTRLRVPGAAPGAPRGTGPGNGPGNRAWSPAKRVAAVLAACAVLGGGTYAVVQATSTPAAARSTTTQAAAQAGLAANATEQAAVLQAAIATPGIRRLERLRLV